MSTLDDTESKRDRRKNNNIHFNKGIRICSSFMLSILFTYYYYCYYYKYIRIRTIYYSVAAVSLSLSLHFLLARVLELCTCKFK